MPYRFTVTVLRSRFEEAQRFNVQGEDLVSGQRRTDQYTLNGRTHQDYLRFFLEIARDHGIGVPLHPGAQPGRVFQGQYCELITDNLVPDIVYGYGDPAIFTATSGCGDSWYYVVCTSNDAPDCFPLIRSRDLKVWEPRGFLFPRGHTPTWAVVGKNVADYWAPEVHYIQDEFRAYFVARDIGTRELCIGVAKSKDPEGPYIAHPKPLLTSNRIDPHVFVDGNVTYLYWKEDSNGLWPSQLNVLLKQSPELLERLFETEEEQRTAAFMAALWPWIRELEPMERSRAQQPLIEAVTLHFSSFRERLRILIEKERDTNVQRQVLEIFTNLRTIVFAQPLASDGLQLLGNPTEVLYNDQPWEAHVIEGMWVTKHKDKYYMFYSGNDFGTANYGIGVAVGSSPLGPFVKRAGALLQSTSKWLAPGHPTFAIGLHGEHMLLFHAYRPNAVGYKHFRALLCTLVEFGAGHPHLPDNTSVFNCSE